MKGESQRPRLVGDVTIILSKGKKIAVPRLAGKIGLCKNWKGPEITPFLAPVQKQGAVIRIERDLVG